MPAKLIYRTAKRRLQILALKIPRGQLAQNTLLSLFWQGMRVLFLLIWIVFLARLLGAEGYGVFSGVAGLAVILGSFSGLGLGLLMYQDTVINPDVFADRWGDALWATILGGCSFFAVFIAISIAVFPLIQVQTLVAIGLAELVFFPLVTTSAYAFASKIRIGWSSALPSLVAFLRCISIAIFAATDVPKDFDNYVWFHLLATVMSSLIIVFLVKSILKPEFKPYTLNVAKLRKGIVFCFSWASTSALTSADKTSVLKIGGGEMAGLYSSSYRIASIFLLPIDALVNAVVPKLFLQGSANHGNSALVSYVLMALLSYSVLAGLVLLTLPGFIVWVLGPSFVMAAGVIKWFSLLIPCYAMRTLSTHILLTSGNVRLKVFAEVGGLGLLILLGLLLIPLYGLIGAAFMIIVTEAIVALVCWLLILGTHR